MVICLEQGANELHMVQLMPMPPIFSCFIKIQIVLTFLVPANLGRRGKEVVRRGVRVDAEPEKLENSEIGQHLAEFAL